MPIVATAYHAQVSVAEGSGGGHVMRRSPQMKLFLEFARRIKIDRLDPFDQSVGRALGIALVPGIVGSENAQDMLFHLLYPENFEPIISRRIKQQVLARFSAGAGKSADIDDALRHLRPIVAERIGREDFDFFDEDVRDIVGPGETENGPGRRYWKIAPGDRGGRWDEFETGQVASVLWEGSPDLRTLDASSEDILKQRLESIPEMQRHNYRFKHAAEQLWRFWHEMAPGDLICGYSAGTVFGWGRVAGDYSYVESATYPHQRPVNWIQTEPVSVDFLSPTLQQKLKRHTTIFELTSAEFDEIRQGTTGPTGGDILAEATHLDLADLQEIESLLINKKQLIFEGPPGSGKTFLADLFARYFTGNPLEGEHNEQIEVVQFHQSYGYEDFVQGIRPVTDGEGRLQYRVMSGIFLRHCDRARANPDKRFVLIIDEINRGNLSRIFGELLMLLEYREKRVRLPYAAGDDPTEQTHLQIPPNLYLIGTMNSTDRSLSMIDYALRRRFFFYRLLPVVDGQATTLERWMAAKGFDAADRERVVGYFVRINGEIGERLSADFQIGHSYFMVDDIATAAGMNRVWRRALKPLLEEYFHTARGLDGVIAALAPETMRPVRVVTSPFGDPDDPIQAGGLSAHEE